MQLYIPYYILIICSVEGYIQNSALKDCNQKITNISKRTKYQILIQIIQILYLISQQSNTIYQKYQIKLQISHILTICSLQINKFINYEWKFKILGQNIFIQFIFHQIIRFKVVKDFSKIMRHKNINIQTNFLNDDSQVEAYPNSQEVLYLEQNRMEQAAIFLQNVLTTLRIRRLVVGFNYISNNKTLSSESDRKMHRQVSRVFNIRKDEGNIAGKGSQMESWPNNSVQFSNSSLDFSLSQENKYSTRGRKMKKRVDQHESLEHSRGSQPLKHSSGIQQKKMNSQLNFENYGRKSHHKQEQANLQSKTVNQRIQRLQRLIENIRKQKQSNEPTVIREKVIVQQIPPKQQPPYDLFMFELKALRNQVHQLRQVNQAILVQSRSISKSHSNACSRIKKDPDDEYEKRRYQHSRNNSDTINDQDRTYRRTQSNYVRTRQNSHEVNDNDYLSKRTSTLTQNKHKRPINGFKEKDDPIDHFLNKTFFNRGINSKMSEDLKRSQQIISEKVTAKNAERKQFNQYLPINGSINEPINNHQPNKNVKKYITEKNSPKDERKNKRIRQNTDTTSQQIWKLLGIKAPSNESNNYKSQRIHTQRVDQIRKKPSEIKTARFGTQFNIYNEQFNKKYQSIPSNSVELMKKQQNSLNKAQVSYERPTPHQPNSPKSGKIIQQPHPQINYHNHQAQPRPHPPPHNYNNTIKNERVHSLQHNKSNVQKNVQKLGYSTVVRGVQYHLPHKSHYYSNAPFNK